MTPTDSDQMVDVVNDITADWDKFVPMYLGLAPSPCVRGSHGVRLERQSLLEGGSLIGL